MVAFWDSEPTDVSMNPSPSPLSRRRFIQLGSLAAAGTAAAGSLSGQTASPAPPVPAFTLEPLPYPPDALEPFVDTRTMEIHHGKHHAAYVAGLNSALTNQPSLQGKTLESLLAMLPEIQDPATRNAVRNHGGGHWNHRFFWESMISPAKAAQQSPAPALLKAMESGFGSVDGFKQAFTAAATKRFGSGWAWLLLDPATGSLKVTSTANQDNPLMKGVVPDDEVGLPLLGLDVWEHAYYLHYQQRRVDYIGAWWNLVDWERISKRYQTASA